ncbi:DEAD/DEAH box helicase, partial [Pseudoalteromonas issachenkonii]
MSATTFSSLNLDPLLLPAIEQNNYTQPTAIQIKNIPPILAGRDVMGSA